MELTNIQLLKFARGSISIDDFEKWLYSISELETEIGSELYLKLISVDFSKLDFVFRIKEEIINYLKTKDIIKCLCCLWKDNEKLVLGDETIEPLDSKFERIKARTPWLELDKCKICNQSWYVAIDTVDDDYYFVRLNDIEEKAILESNKWPNRFDNMMNVWPYEGWYKANGYKDLKDWQNKNNSQK